MVTYMHWWQIWIWVLHWIWWNRIIAIVITYYWPLTGVIKLICKWLTNRIFYVSLYGSNSYLHQLNMGTVQGSALWSILYALFVSSLLDRAKITLFVDGNYILECNKHKEQLTVKMEEKLEIITNWFRDSVMKDIVSKMEMCLFHWKDQPPSNLYLMAKS